MIYFRCTICQPSPSPRPGVLYFTEDQWSSRCPRCGGALAFERIKGVTARSQADAARMRNSTAALASTRTRARAAADDEGEADDADDEGTATAVLASKARVEKERERLANVDDGLDRVLGGGWVKGITYALHGPHGSGKSRLLRLAAALMCRHGHVVYAVSPKEEHASDVLRRLHSSSHNGVPYMKLPGVKERLHVIPNADNSDRIARIAMELGAVFVVVDSASTVGTNNAPRQPHRQQAYAIELFRGIAKDCGTTFALLTHEDADGRLKGGTLGPYMADAVLTVSMMTRLKGGRVRRLADDERERKFKGLVQFGNEKNRFAPPGLLALFQLDDAGIIAAPPAVEDEEEPAHVAPEPTPGPENRQRHRAPVPNVRPKGQGGRLQAGRVR